MIKFDKLTPPTRGEKLVVRDGRVQVPDNPIIPFIEGDGTGPDIWRASRRVWEAAIQKAYQGKRKIEWFQMHAGLSALKVYGGDCVLPEDTLNAVREYLIAIKGPLTTPVGGFKYVCLVCAKEQDDIAGKRPTTCIKCNSEYVTPRFRSSNVALRQKLGLYACVRPVRWFEGVPAPVKNPEKLNVIIFRENTEDVYAGMEFEEGTEETKRFIEVLGKEFGKNVLMDSGISIKPISITATKRLVRKAINYAIQHKKPSVTIVHKGNIMKFTEGAFRDWAYQLTREEFQDQVITELDVTEKFGGKVPEGKVVIKDRIADQMFQQVLLRPDEYSVIATPNLNGDYLSDAVAAQVGGLGMAPGANMSDDIAFFEATHGTAPKYAGLDMVNPGSLILSGVMMLEYLGWQEAADMIVAALELTIKQKRVTYDLERQMVGAKKLKTSEFASAIIENMGQE